MSRKSLFAKWRYGDVGLNWKTVARLGELAYRCNVCRRCAQTCPIGVDNGLDCRPRNTQAFSARKWASIRAELHEKGHGQPDEGRFFHRHDPDVVRENVEFIDEDYSEITGIGIPATL